MINLIAKEEIEQITKLYGIKGVSAIVKKESDSPDSNLYLIQDERGTKYVLRESDHMSELKFEKQGMEKKLNIRVRDFIKLLLPNDEIAKDEEYLTNVDGWYYLLAQYTDGES